MGLSSAVKTAIERYPMDYEFGLWDLKNDVLRIDPSTKFCHADTASRRLREFRHGKDYEIICIKPHLSRYKKMSKKDAAKWLRAKIERLMREAS